MNGCLVHCAPDAGVTRQVRGDVGGNQTDLRWCGRSPDRPKVVLEETRQAKGVVVGDQTDQR